HHVEPRVEHSEEGRRRVDHGRPLRVRGDHQRLEFLAEGADRSRTADAADTQQKKAAAVAAAGDKGDRVQYTGSLSSTHLPCVRVLGPSAVCPWVHTKKK
ncbi:unnamed protein product, partial [Ectocarpus fasciculatus]